MSKKFLLVIAFMGGVVASSTAASAAFVEVRVPSSSKSAQKPASQKPAAAKLAISDSEPDQQQGQTEQQDSPQSVPPEVEQKRKFLGLPLLGLLAVTGTAVAVTNSASP